MIPGARDAGAWARLVALGAIWGASFVGIAVALEGFGPVTVAAGRLALAAGALTAAAYALGPGLPPLRGPGARVWPFALAVASLTNAAPFLLISWGQLHVPAGVAAIFMAMLPLAALPLAHVFVPDDPLTRRKALGFATGVLGGVVLIGPDAFAGLSVAGVRLVAQLAFIAAVTCYACGGVVIKRAPPCHPLSLSAAALLLAAAALAPAALWLEGAPPLDAGARPWAALAFLGLVPTALATVLLVQLMRRTGPSFVTQVNFMIPLWGLVFAVVLLGEEPPLRALLALALILLGVAVAHGVIGRKPRLA